MLIEGFEYTHILLNAVFKCHPVKEGLKGFFSRAVHYEVHI